MIPLVALVATGGCFATRNDVRIVQADVASLRTEMMKNDAAQRDALLQAMRLVAAITDSLTRISARTLGIQGDVRGEFRNVNQQLLQLQTLLGQSQANVNRLRAVMETRNNAVPVTPPLATPPAAATGGTPPVAGAVTGAVAVAADSAAPGPGAAQLYQNGRDQLRRGSTSTARTYFQELLSKYPESDLAPDAQNSIAQSLESEKNVNGADAAYAAVVTKYPDSRVAPNALYKRAQIALNKGNTPEARKLLQEVVSRYPKSMEADLATEQLKTVR
jgi:tol-pal system protein YbgF